MGYRDGPKPRPRIYWSEIDKLYFVEGPRGTKVRVFEKLTPCGPDGFEARTVPILLVKDD